MNFSTQTHYQGLVSVNRFNVNKWLCDFTGDTGMILRLGLRHRGDQRNGDRFHMKKVQTIVVNFISGKVLLCKIKLILKNAWQTKSLLCQIICTSTVFTQGVWFLIYQVIRNVINHPGHGYMIIYLRFYKMFYVKGNKIKGRPCNQKFTYSGHMHLYREDFIFETAFFKIITLYCWKADEDSEWIRNSSSKEHVAS